MFASASASFRGTWRARCIPRINYGPKPCSPSLSEQIVYSLPSQLWDTGGITDKFNQCVFIRYHKMDWRERWEAFFRKLIMRAGAGPHDLGSGDNKGDAHPELTVQLDAEATTNGDEDLGGQCGPIGEGTGPEPDVVQNAPYEEEHDSWDAIADYVFRNSKATSVLMHHGDLAEIHAIEGLDDISSTLAREGPHIAVDEDGGQFTSQTSSHNLTLS
ncbi:hypothetical protein BDM02DRAFT_2063638 [Thelephora ganbajun]|uniref:Uncharacterized protein n=1 Tax=Thelephora ganbajun TaxID=370292 RepID=A0ACB6YZ93_THEGA|nr:hypothetical protein BDM02DRAFT_2063638 [Thelephora ganbajun]